MQLYISIVIPIFFLFFYLKKVEVDADSELSAASKASFLDKVRQSNQACQNGDFETAVGLYGEAIALDPCNHILFSNRSAALVKLGHFARALQDASRAVELNAKWPKVSLRVKSLQPALLQSIHLVLLFKHGALLFGSLYLDKEPRGGKTSSSFPPQNTKARFFFFLPQKNNPLCEPIAAGGPIKSGALLTGRSPPLLFFFSLSISLFSCKKEEEENNQRVCCDALD